MAHHALQRGYEKRKFWGGPKKLACVAGIEFVTFAGLESPVLGDIRDLSFVPDGTISHIHSNHVIEHLSSEELQLQLTQWYRVLKEEGIVSIRCPNALGVAFGFWFPPVSEEGRAEFLRLGVAATLTTRI